MLDLSSMHIGTQARALAAALALGAAVLSLSTGPTAYAARVISTDAGDAGTGDGGMDTGSTTVYAVRTKANLIAAGYTCTHIATGFDECTKSGSDTYWCDASGSCDVKPFRNTTDVYVAPQGGVLSTAP